MLCRLLKFVAISKLEICPPSKINTALELLAQALLENNAPEILFYYCEDVEQAIPAAIEIEPTVILQDLVKILQGIFK